jgi:hypothetical protein
MSLIAKAEGNSQGFEPVAEGVHIARCIGLIDLGMQYSEKFDKTAHKALIMWELPDETYEQDGETKCRVLSKEYTMSLHEKSSLTKVLEAWRGKKFTEEELAGFDLNNILGKGCQVQIIHTKKGENTYSNIAAIMGMPKGMKVDAPKTTIVFDLDDPKAIIQMSTLPEWIQTKIKESTTWKELSSSQDAPAPTDDDDELPF